MILQLYKLYTLIFLCIVAVSCTSTTKPTKSTKVVTGFVYEFEGGIGPIPFAEVKVKGTERKTVTDWDGKFSIEVIKGDFLEIKVIGYSFKEIIITDANKYRIHLLADDRHIWQ